MAKRQKQVFSKMDSLASVWAKQSQAYGRCAYTQERNGNGQICRGFFEGNSIASYGRHYLLGRIMQYNGVQVAAINTSRYSNTTTGHTSDARCAARDAGLLVVEFDTGGEHYIPFHAPDSVVSAAITATLESKADYIQTRLEAITYDVYSTYEVDSLKESLKDFNILVENLGLENMRIDVPEEYLAEVMELAKLRTRARKDHSSREQTIFNFSAEDRSLVKGLLIKRPQWSEAKSLQKRTC